MENTITSKRKAYSAVEKAALIAAYKASGLSKKEWCQENAIGLSTLQRWLQHEKKAGPAATGTKLDSCHPGCARTISQPRNTNRQMQNCRRY